MKPRIKPHDVFPGEWVCRSIEPGGWKGFHLVRGFGTSWKQAYEDWLEKKRTDQLRLKP